MLGGFSINFKQITLEDKGLFDKFFQQRRYENAHFNFTNLFMWRKAYNIKWTVEEECLCIMAGRENEYFVLPPFASQGADMARALDKMMEHFAENKWLFNLRGAEKSTLEMVETAKPGLFTWVPERDNFDYVYYAQDLIELKGRKYHSKKNHVNSFKKAYSGYSYLPLTTDLMGMCINMLIEWCEKKDCYQDDILASETNAIIEALESYPYLGLTGGVIMLDGKVEAFTFGEQLNQDTAVIHVEKANPDIRGVYAVINQEFCRNNWQRMKYINREEDMGIEGLRKAKESYHPAKMVEKYTITLR